MPLSEAGRCGTVPVVFLQQFHFACPHPLQLTVVIVVVTENVEHAVYRT